MSGGSYPGGAAVDALGWRFYVGGACILIVVLGGIGGMFLAAFEQHRDLADKQVRETAAAEFHPGDVVRSRVTNFRGMVVGRSCLDACLYDVRFYQASMQPVWVAGYEIQVVPK